MGKNIKKNQPGRKPKQTFVPLSTCALRDKSKSKIILKEGQTKRPKIHLSKFGKLLNEEILCCSICLQLLLKPVLAECGHSFCLYCSEDLAKNGFACGICHTHLPSYDLQPAPIIEQLVNEYLDHQVRQEREHYLQRRQEMQRKQENRRVKDIQEGSVVDFWCEDEIKWKSGTVTEKMKNGMLTITPNRSSKEISLHLDSRRLAPYRTFSNEEVVPEASQFQFRAMNLPTNSPFDPMRMRMAQRPYIFGMPLFLGYIWPDGHFRGEAEVVQDDNQLPF